VIIVVTITADKFLPLEIIEQLSRNYEKEKKRRKTKKQADGEREKETRRLCVHPLRLCTMGLVKARGFAPQNFSRFSGLQTYSMFSDRQKGP
jgi:hypothetical protein